MTSSLLSTASTASSLASNPLINQSATGSGSSSSTSSTSSATTTSSALSSLDYNFNEFLQLFTTQLKNQDPTNPMDTTSMTNQLAMFSEVEQQAGTNSRLDKLIAAQPSSSLGSAIGYIGQTVQATGDNVVLSGGTGTLAYSLPSTANSVSINVLDSNGVLVDTITGGSSDTTSGSHQITWNGTDSSGNTVADGTYTFNVNATDSSGSSITPTTYTTGKVTGIESNSTGTVLNLGSGVQVDMSNVLAVQ